MAYSRSSSLAIIWPRRNLLAVVDVESGDTPIDLGSNLTLMTRAHRALGDDGYDEVALIRLRNAH